MTSKFFLSITCLFLIALSLSSSAFAASNGTTGFMSNIGAYGTLGSMGNTDGTIESRSTNTGALYLDLGYKFSFFAPFVRFDYGFTAQTKDPSSVGNQNLSGSGYLASGGLALYYRRVALTLGYEFTGSYKLTKKTTGDLDSIYTEPSGLMAMLTYYFDPRKSVFFIFQQTGYAKSTIGPNTTDLGSNKLSHTSYGIGLTYAIF